jgi:hypothetical protein
LTGVPVDSFKTLHGNSGSIFMKNLSFISAMWL